MKKEMQHLLSRQLLLAAISSALILCSCSKENIYAPNKSGATREVTLKAGITSGTTKVGFEDRNSEGVKLTWEDGDGLTLFKADGTQAGTLWLSSGSGSSSGTFTGVITANPGDELTIAYPSANSGVTKSQYDIAKGATLSIQTQEGNSTTVHLKNAAFMDATATLGEGSVLPAATLTNRQTLLTLKVHKPADWKTSDGDPTQLHITISGTSYTLNLSNAESWSNNKDLVAWLAIVPDNSSSKNVSVQVVMPGTGDQYVMSTTSSKVYSAGTRYTSTLGTLTRTDGAFSFTVRTDAPGTSNPTTMMIPFDGSVPSGTTLTVDWGNADATCNLGTTNHGVTTLPGGTNVTDITGTYLAAGTYTIKISSSAPVTQQQMPIFYYNANDNDHAKFITLDSPILNTNAANIAEFFKDCTNLISIPSTLFINNTEAQVFYSTFSGCKSLTAIPAGLFSYNLKAPSFVNCFYNCIKARIEGDPFINGTTATKENRFVNFHSTNFGGCFYAVASDASVVDKGNAPELWDYTYQENASVMTYSSGYCFQGTSFANDSSIPNTGNIYYTMATTGKIPADALNWKEAP